MTSADQGSAVGDAGGRSLCFCTLCGEMRSPEEYDAVDGRYGHRLPPCDGDMWTDDDWCEGGPIPGRWSPDSHPLAERLLALEVAVAALLDCEPMSDRFHDRLLELRKVAR